MARLRSLFLTRLTTALVCALLVAPLSAQDLRAPQSQAEGGRLSRALYGNFTSPAVHAIPVRGESLLDSMIRDGKLSLSEQDAVNLALANNVDMNVQRYVPYLQLWGIEGARGVLNPTVQFTPGMTRNVTPATSALQGGASVLSLSNSYNLNVHKPFESGLDFDFNYSTVRARTNSFFSSLNPSLTSLWSIGFTQHLLQGFGNISRGRLLWVARNNYKVYVENFSVSVINTVNSVLNAYWNLVYNDEDIAVKEASLKLAQLTLEQTQIQEQVGTMAPLDVLQAQAQVASVNQQLIVSRYNRRITEDQLKKLISANPAAGLMTAAIVPTGKVTPPSQPPAGLNDAIQRAVENRPEVKSQLLNLANSKIQVDYARNQLRPVLDFTVGYSQNGLGGNNVVRDYTNGFFNAPIVAFIPGGFGQSLSSLFSGSNIGYNLGFTLRVPIGNDQARANSAQAQITYKQGEETLRALRQQITYQVRQAYDAVALNQASVQAAQVAVDYQEKRLQGEQDKFSLGASTTFLVLQAQRDLDNARNVLLQAKVAWIQSRIALDQAVGDTLAAHGIAIEDTLNLPRN